MKYLFFWLIFGLLVSCHARAADETWIMKAIALNATTGEILEERQVRSSQGVATWKDGGACVKAALDMGPIPVRDNIAVMIVCRKLESV